MQRIYFICPKTGKQFSFTSDIPSERIAGALFREMACRRCGELHSFSGRDAQKWHAVPKPKGLRISR